MTTTNPCAATLPITSPRITLVTPSFNQARFLEETIRSILDQNYPNLEYIVIDGGSTDGSVDIIRKYADRLAYWCSEPDQGQYDALNKGFARSTGHIMAWINADDLYFPWTLRTVAEVFTAFPTVQWISSLLPAILNPYGVVIGVYPKPGFHSGFFQRGDYSDDGNTLQLGCIQQESTFWRRGLWEQAGGRLDATYRLAADFELWDRFFRYEHLYGVRACLGVFRSHGDQRSVTHLQTYLAEMQSILARHRQRLPKLLAAHSRRWGLHKVWPFRVLPSLGFVHMVQNIAWNDRSQKWATYSAQVP
jgi:hypothetical protein